MIEVVFSEEVVGVGQGKKVTIIPDIQSAGDRSGGCHKIKFQVNTRISIHLLSPSLPLRGVNITKLVRFSSDYSCNRTHIGEKWDIFTRSNYQFHKRRSLS